MKSVKRLLICVLFLSILFSILPVQTVSAEEYWPVGPEVKAASAILMEADTGAILYEKNIHTQHYPASITKIMTTLLALDNSSMQDVVTFSRDSVYKTEGSMVGFMDGEQVTMEHCLYSIMLASANEAAYAVAEHVGGTLENFVQMMNDKAATLGCTETHFSNPHGLPDETHVTSAHDMALIAQAAYKNENFRSITKTVSYTVPATNKTTETRPFANHHKMLKKGQFKYEYCTGGKTGYTNAARNTLVTFAEKNDLKLICVIMRDDVSEDQYLDTESLLDYGFNNFKKVQVTESDLGLQLSSEGFFPIRNNPLAKDSGKIALSTSAQLVIPNQLSLGNVTSLINFTENTSGEIATITCSIGEHFTGKVSITYTPGENSLKATKAPKVAKEEPSNPLPIKNILFGTAGVIGVLAIVGLVLYCIRNGVFEVDYAKKPQKQRIKGRKGNSRRRSRALPSTRKRRPPKRTPRKSIGTAKTPRLHSEFEVSDSSTTQRSKRTIDDYLKQ